MKHFLILSMVAVLSACASSSDQGALSAEQRAAQEAARQQAQRQEELRRQEEAREEAARQEEERRIEQERVAEEQQQLEEERRIEQERIAEEQQQLEEERRIEQERIAEEQQRQEEERRIEQERIAEEQQRQEEMLREEEARLEEQRQQEELRRQEEQRQIEALRQQRMEDDDDPSLVGMVTEEQLRKANSLLLEQAIYFDFDRYTINPKYAPIIAAHARFLIVNPTVKIFVEGNCDDRGSPEYNIALGQRRADAVQRALLALGVPPRQVEAVSYGAERPVAYGANDASWARNRRADIAYPMFKK